MNADIRCGGDPALIAQAEDLLRRCLRVPAPNPVYLMHRRPSLEGLIELLADDLPAALDGEYQTFIGACAAKDWCQVGELVNRALERCATRYLDSPVGKRELENALRTLEMEDAA